MRQKSKQTGFTLIEVMIVTAIIGILAAIVLPNVRYYTMRAQVSEALIAFTKCRTLITELYSSGDTKSANDWGCEESSASKYVDLIQTTANGTIIVWVNNTNDLRLDHHRISMAPMDGNGAPMSGMGNIRSWRCGSPVDGTDLDGKYLPGSCRGI